MEPATTDRVPTERRFPIRVRHPKLDLSSEIPRYWMGGDAFATHFLNALSSTFPDGEAFFVRSVRHYADQIEDPELQRAARDFGAQEGMHSREHGRHLELLLAQGYTGIGTRNAFERRMLRWSNRRMPKSSLAATAALEHLTAILARRLLSEPERWTGEMDARMAPFWQWHALEEAEHKAVAFDVLQIVAPSYLLRTWTLFLNTGALFLEIFDRTAYMLWKDGLLFRRATWTGGLRFLFGRDGFLRGLGRDYAAWYRRDFHPDQIDDRPLVTAWNERLQAQGI